MRRQVNRVVVVLGLAVVLPLVALADRVRRGAGRTVARGAVRVLSRACGIRFEVRGAEHVDSGGSVVFVANHSSPLDIPAMLVACGDVRFLAAADLYRNPLLAAAMRALDSIPVDRTNGPAALRGLRSLAAAEGRLCVAVFPEGGIAPAGRRLPFKSGAFMLAIEAGASVVPAAVHGTDVVLPPGGRLAPRPGTVTVELLAPIPTTGLGPRDRNDLRDRAEAAVLAALGASTP